MTTLHRVHCLMAACLTGTVLAAPAAARFDPAPVALESPAVAARFPDPDISYDTPGFLAGREDFTAHAELMEYVSRLQQRTGAFTLRIIGTSKEQRAIPLLVFASPTNAT